MACTTNSESPRASSSESSPVTSGTSPLTFGATLLTSANGPASTSKPFNSSDELEILWIPEGFAHGFLVLSDTAEVLYKTTNFYHPAGERTILWNDPTLKIDWPLTALGSLLLPSISPKDAQGSLFTEAELPPE